MQDDIKWITRNGKHIPITNEYMNNKIRQKTNKELEKEQYFKDNFYIEDGDYNKETFIKKNDNNKSYTFENLYDKEKKGYREGMTGYIKKRISVIDKKSGNEIGFLKYRENYENNYVGEKKVKIDIIKVKDEYKRKGIATQMYKELQKRIGDTEIYFGEFTPEGKKVVEKIGKITKEKKVNSLNIGVK